MPNNDYVAFIADLEVKRSALERSIRAVDAALEGARILAADKTLESTASEPSADRTEKIKQVYPPITNTLARFANMTIPQASEIALRDAGHPLSTRELHNALVAGGFETKAKNFMTTIGSVLNRHSKEVGIVRRVPNGWGLKEWEIAPEQVA